jgi:hypothetical protein
LLRSDAARRAGTVPLVKIQTSGLISGIGRIARSWL